MDDIERLRQIHEGNERVEAVAYANLVRQALRSEPWVARDFLQETYEKGLQEAYSSRSIGALGKVAQMGAEQLTAIGDHAGAIARLDQALQMALDDSASRARILGMRAVWEAMTESPTVATRTLVDANDALSDGLDVETVVGVASNAAAVRLILLVPGATDEATAAISNARRNEFDWMASATMVFLIEALASSSESNQATAWADALHGYAASLSHPARELDARIAQFALRSRRRIADPPAEMEEVGHRTLNTIALWRLQILRIYIRVMSGNRDEAIETADALEALRSEVSGGFAVASGGFSSFVAAHFGSRPVREALDPVPAPDGATLLMLSGALASAEAAAIGGSQSVAADWLRWFETRLPPTVATSLEWPACRKRIEGLLLLRLGREREAVGRLQDAIQCCEARQDEVQAAIGRVQLSEALLRGSTASMLPAAHARTIRDEGAEELRSLGVDPIPFAYAASRTFLREEQMPERGGLTPREAQVLGRLAKGMSYREIGADLGINSRTVGVHASHCYEKLGVRNRVEAVKLAQDLGVV